MASIAATTAGSSTSSAIGAGVSMAFSEGLSSDTGELTGRGNVLARRMDTAFADGHTARRDHHMTMKFSTIGG
jgi:prepilin-type processing-associated H-X9-DG protein